MRVTIEATTSSIRLGIAARAHGIGLVGHGLDEEEALEGMTAAVRAWCINLHALGLLQKALKHRGIHWDGDSDEAPQLEVRVVESVGR